MWSGLEDEQLVGREQRFPQVKQVGVYRLIANYTQDVFLDNNSFSKLTIHKAFIEASPAMRKSH